MAAIAEQRLLNRVMRLTLVLGIVIGICLILFAVLLYDVFIARRSGFHIAAQGVDELLLPLVMILQGIAFILRWRAYILRSHLPGFQRNTKRELSIRQQALTGLFIIGLSCFFLIAIALDLPFSVFPLVLIAGSVGGICLVLGFDRYFSRWDAQHGVQH